MTFLDRRRLSGFAAAFVLCALGRAGIGQAREVSVYVSVDFEHAEEILKAFEQKTGIKVKSTTDAEVNKTVGNVNRILNEAKEPRADVFWNNECGQTLRLKEKGLLEAYASPSAADIPAQYKDPDGQWTGFAARARIIAYNTKLVTDDQVPKRVRDLADARFKGQGVMSKPIAGTALTHVGALYALDGKDKTDAWLEALVANDVRFTPGNGPAMREVAEAAKGGRTFCLTDTDDAHGSQLEGFPTKVVWPDQGADDPGILLIPNSVMLIKGAKHPVEAKAFIDYLLSPDVEAALAKGRSAQIPVRASVARPPHVRSIAELKVMPVDWAVVARMIDNQADRLGRTFESAPSPSQPGAPAAQNRTATWVLLGVLALAILFVVIRRVGAARTGEGV
jgi:iron(III) transport system substrate-binding protein